MKERITFLNKYLHHVLVYLNENYIKNWIGSDESRGIENLKGQLFWGVEFGKE